MNDTELAALVARLRRMRQQKVSRSSSYGSSVRRMVGYAPERAVGDHARLAARAALDREALDVVIVAVTALQRIADGGDCGCENHDDTECCANTEFWCPECIAAQALLRYTDGEGSRGCVWTEDADGGWHTACGRTWEFSDGGPAENRMVYCMGCGQTVRAEGEKGQS